MLTQTRIMAPAVRVATESASQNGEKSVTKGRMYESWPTDWTTANTRAANFWMRKNCARPCEHDTAVISISVAACKDPNLRNKNLPSLQKQPCS